MFAKLVVLILGLTVILGGLLSLRQMRINCAHRTALVLKATGERDHNLWRLRLEIASLITPDRVQQGAVALGILKPNTVERYTELVRLEDAVRMRDAVTTVQAETASVD